MQNCQLGDPYDPQAKIVVQSRQEKDDYLLPKICKQIEFYLGDANLQHDNYFRRLLKQNQNWIPLETFLKCNKIKSLMRNYPKGTKQQICILAYSLQRSDILIVQEDRVKRKIPFEDDSNYMDIRTIYVENIPLQVNEQLLHKIFNRQSSVENKETVVICIHNVPQHRKCQQGHSILQQSCTKRTYRLGKQGECNLVMIRGGLRVMSKQDWLQYKQQCKSFKRKQQQLTEEPVKIKLTSIQTEDLLIEELRIAVGHAVPSKQVKHINIQNDICVLECTQEAAQIIKQNIHRIQNYDDRFQNCQVS